MNHPTPASWADLAAILCDPIHPARILAPTDGNNGAQPLDQGKAGDLARTAPDDVAIVAPIRADLDAFDLDGCAEQVRPMIVAAAEGVGGIVVYLARSGSDDSEHVVVGCPNPAARGAFLDQVETIRTWSSAGERLDHRHGAGGGFRLPGSVSLKGRGHVAPISEDGRLLSPTAATRAARKALKIIRLPLTPPRVRSSVHVDREADTVAAPPPLLRAWKRRRPFTEIEHLRLNADGNRGDRSLTAVRAAWALWCVGIRSWAEAGDYYASKPAFSKFAFRRDGGRSHWERLAERWASYRGAVDPEDQANADQWIDNARGWADHDLVAALVAVIVYRFTDGRGTTSRPIAVRDLALWTGFTRPTAARRLHQLRDCGAIEVARHYLDGRPDEATLYSLCEAFAVEDVTGVTLDPAIVLHPVWHVLGHQARAVRSALDTNPVTTSELAAITNSAVGDDTYGVRRALTQLAEQGLATRHGRGRGTKWTRGEVSLMQAADRVGVVAKAAALAEQVNLERAIFHADSAAERVQVAQGVQGVLQTA